jgi:sugar phosphate permease
MWGCTSHLRPVGSSMLANAVGMMDTSGGRGKDVRRTGRWRALVLLSATLVLCMSTWFSASAVIPQLRVVWALSDTAAAWLTIAVQLGFVCGALVSSFLNLSDIISPRHVILGGAVGATIVNGLLAISSSAVAGIPLRFATGFFLAGVYPPAFKLISTWFKKGRGVALGILAGALVVGNAMPHLVNGLGGLDWRLVIYVTSVLTLAGGLIAEFAVKEGPFPFPRAIFDPKQAGRVFSNRGVRLASFG